MARRLPFLFWVALLLPAGACSSDATGSGGNPPPHDVLIVKDAAQKGDQAFSPATYTHSLASGTSITWYNGDIIGGAGSTGGITGITHRLVSDDGTSFVGDFVAAGGSWVLTITTPGTYPYHCSLHPSMTGTLVVNP